jgi:hypothetical protein
VRVVTSPLIDNDESYAAFLSYRSTSLAPAKQIRKALLALARRHGAEQFRVFLDTSSLLVGSLNAEITGALEGSQHLVVLLGHDTAGSTWVEREIEHWLAHGGSPDRLFLVRLEPAVDLTWDEATGTFAHPEAVPAPLRSCFDTEQKWVDLSAPGSAANEAALAPLYAALMGVETSALLLEEAEYQRRRRRIVAGAVGVMAVLLVLSIIGGVLALVSRNDANQQRDAARAAATRAQAESDASAALLAVPASYPEAISHVLDAARQADTPGVRSAMLSVAADTGGLIAAFDTHVHGTDLTDATLDDTGSLLATWGTSGAHGLRLQLHDLAAHRLLVDLELDLTAVTDVKVLSPSRLAVCDADGVTMVEVTSGKPTYTRVVDTPSTDDCRLVQLDGGAVVGSATGPAGPASAYLPRQDATVPIDGAGAVARGTDTALVSGPAGTWLVSPSGVRQLSSTPAVGTGWGDSFRNFFLQTAPDTWTFAFPTDGWQLHTAVQAGDAVEAAPIVDSSMTGQAAWVTADGHVRWTGDDSSVQLADDTSEAGQPAWRTRLFSLTNGELLAVWRYGTTYLLPPGATGVGDDWTALDNGWKYRSFAENGLPDTDQEDPAYPGCSPGGQVALRYAPGGGVLVDDAGDTTSFRDFVGFGPDCTVIDAGSGLRLLGSVGAPELAILPEYTGQQVDVSTYSVNQLYRAVLVAPGAATAVVQLNDAAVPGPWGVSRSGGGALSGLGERRVVVQALVSGATRLVFVGPDGVSVPAGDLPPGSTLVAVRPDGLGAVTGVDTGERTLVDEKEAVPLACTGQPVAYLPAPDFETSVEAAEAMVPAAYLEGSWSHCRASDPTPVTQQSVASYDVGATRGLIVADADDGHLEVVSWSRSDDGPSVVAAPPGSDAAHLGLTPDGRQAVTVDDRRTVRVWARTSSGWRVTGSLASSLPAVVGIDLVDDASLVLLVGPDGTFELLDAATGRRLVGSHTATAAGFDEGDITAVRTTVRDGVLYVYEHRDDSPSDSQVLDVPISIPVLRSLLCAVYAAPSCPSGS